MKLNPLKYSTISTCTYSRCYTMYMYFYYWFTCSALVNPITVVGVKARDRNRESGYQNQNWENTNKPTTVGMWVWPVRDWREIVTLRPPVSRRMWRKTRKERRGREREKEGQHTCIWITNMVKYTWKHVHTQYMYSTCILTCINDSLCNDSTKLCHRVL